MLWAKAILRNQAYPGPCTPGLRKWSVDKPIIFAQVRSNIFVIIQPSSDQFYVRNLGHNLIIISSFSLVTLLIFIINTNHKLSNGIPIVNKNIIMNTIK